MELCIVYVYDGVLDLKWWIIEESLKKIERLKLWIKLYNIVLIVILNGVKLFLEVSIFFV